MLARALDVGVPAAWVTADEAYGGDSKFRRWLEDRRISHVVTVSKNPTIPAVADTFQADVLVGHALGEAWKAAVRGQRTTEIVVNRHLAASASDIHRSIISGNGRPAAFIIRG